MGSSSSKNPSSSHGSLDEGGSGGQLYVSLKMENFKSRGDLIPHVFGSVPIIGSWDPSRAHRMERESASTWEISFVVPPNHETLHFHFLLKPKDKDGPCVVEEGVERLLTGGNLEGGARAAVFRHPEFGDDAILEFKVSVKVDIVSPFDLAASWRAYTENLRPSTVRGIPDISISEFPEGEQESGSTTSLELDLESYVVPLPICASATVYAANLAETPRSEGYNREFPKYSVLSVSPTSSTTRVAMPAAAGAVAAAAVADQMHEPKEDRRLAIVLVGLPARGKTFTAAKLTRYLRWLGYETKNFNVGKYRRLKHGSNQTAYFFRGDNPEGMEARNEVAALAMDDMLSWMNDGGQVGIFDATNSSRKRRHMLMKMAEGNCKIIFLEIICNDERIIERNIRLKIQQSPDYAEETDFEAGLLDFKERLANYDKVYEPVEEGSYIKMIDMVSGNEGQIQEHRLTI